MSFFSYSPLYIGIYSKTILKTLAKKKSLIFVKRKTRYFPVFLCSEREVGLLIASQGWQAAHNLNTLDFFIRERPAPLYSSSTGTASSHWDLVDNVTTL